MVFKYSTSIDIREIQIKTTLGFQLTPITEAKIKKINFNNSDVGVEKGIWNLWQ